MIKVILLLVYLTGGELVVDRSHTFKDFEACQKAAPIIMAKVQANPKFNDGIIAMCVLSEVKEA